MKISNTTIVKIIFNRLIGCRLFGHKRISHIENENKEIVLFCWNCYNEIKEDKEKI